MKMKIWLALVIVCIGIATFSAMSASAETEGDYTYSVTDGKATITDFNYSGVKSIEIPSSLGGYPVTAIGKNAFRACALTGVTIPDSVTVIGDAAFAYCSGLTNVIMGDGVTNIGNSAFRECGLKSIIIGNGVTIIGEYAFNQCRSLTEVILGESVERIYGSAFIWCSSLTSITIPASVTGIARSSFFFCSKLTDINVNENNLTYCSIDGVLYNKDATKLVIFPQNKETTGYTIPDSVESIGASAFRYCNNLEILKIPNSVTNIESYAFNDCANLTEITFGNNLESIGERAFMGTKLTDIIFPDSLTSIGGFAFHSCKTLTRVTFGNKLANIGENAFYQCGLEKITIPDSVTVVEESAFNQCTNLKSVVLGDGVTSIEHFAFNECRSLKSIIIPNIVTNIGHYAFQNCKNLCDVYYKGSKEDWKNISIGEYNEYLTNANIHFNFESEDNDKYTDISSNFAQIMYNGVTYNLLLQSISIDKDSSIEVSVKVNYDGGTGNEKIYITQNTIKSVELENNVSKTFRPAEVFSVGKDIYILIVDEQTGKTISKRTRLKIIENTAQGEWLPDGDIGGLNFKLGKETGFTIPEIVPVFGGTEIKWDFDLIPLSVEYDKEDNNKINIVFGANIAHSDGKEDKWFKDFNFKEYKKAFKKAASKQGRTFKQLRNDFKMSNDYKMNLFGDKVIGGGSGKPSFDCNVAGYAEAKIIDGDIKFLEAQLCIEAEVSYKYQGQLFILEVPVYYEIGGGGGAGFEGDMVDIDPQTFRPKFDESYLTAKIKAKIGGGIGVPKAASFGAGGEGTLNLKTAVHKDYLKAWGEGSANFNIKVFGKEVFKNDFLKGDFLIFETGNSNGLISDSAVTFSRYNSPAFCDDDNLGIDVNKVYENESRGYSEYSTEWYGETPPISLMSADYTNKNLQILAENVYTESAPIMCNIDGKKVMVMLWDDEDRDDVNRSMLVYSVCDDSTNLWSYPAPVHNDGTADFYAYFNDGYVVWQNEKSLLDDSMTLADIAELGEICVSKWNGSSFDEPVAITDNDTLDTLPVICASDSEISVVWTKNSENDIIGITGVNSIFKSNFNGSVWSEPQIVKDGLNSIVNLSAGYTADGLNIAYSQDEDNNLQTIIDRDICIISQNSEYNLTDNEVLDSNPVFAGNMVYYYSDGNIEYSVLGADSKNKVFEQAKSGLTDTFTVDTNENGDVAIWWAKTADDATEIFCTLYKDDEWSDEIQISSTGNQSKYPSGILEEDGSMYIAYNNCIRQDGEIIQSDLHTIDLTPSYDLEVVDAYIDEESMTVYTTVKNTGELNVNSYTVTLTDNGINSQKTVNECLKAGQSAEVEIEYVKPEDLDMRTIYFSVSGENEEYDSSNNSADIIVGNCDVVIESVSNYENIPESTVVAIITNTGYSDTGAISVYLRKETVDGTIIKTETIDNLTAGESKEISFAYSIVENDNIQWYITVEAENTEISIANNDTYFINNYLSALPDYKHEILSYNISEKTITINAYIENNTADTLDDISIVVVCDCKGILKKAAFKRIGVTKYSNDTLDFSINNYTYAEGDYIKLFMWNNLEQVIPTIEEKETDIIIQ